MSKLLIVESPNKAKKFASFLDAGWVVKASMGHVRDLPEQEMGVEPPNFRPTYASNERQRKTLAALKQACATASHVYLATDPDREGEAIAWHLKEALKVKDPFRVTFQSMDKAAVLKAIQNPRKIDMDLVRAQEGRRVCDRLVGYMVSKVLCDAARSKLSAGRVQSPTTALVVERELEIRNFVTKPYYEVEITLANGLKLKLLPKSVSKTCERITDRSLAEVIAGITEARITRAETKPQQIHPKPALTTSTLQQAASASFKLSGTDTMRIAQTLFENGVITYHRTDNPNLSEEGYEAACEWLKANGLEYQRGQRRWESKGNAQEAHEAIRPTDFSLVDIEGSDQEKAVYRLIRERALRAQMPCAVDDVTIIEATDLRELNNELDDAFFAVFSAKGRKEVEPGFRALTCSEKEEGEVEDEQKLVATPELENTHRIEHAQVLDKKTQPPKRYTEGSLVAKLEKLGIGRPSTYASILQNVITRGYITVGDPAGGSKQKTMLFASDLGIALVEALKPGRFMDYQFTNQLEKRLDDIAEGKADYLPIVRDLHATVERDLSMLNLAAIQSQRPNGGGDYRQSPCPKCGQSVKRLPSKSRKGEFFWVHVEETTDCEKYLDDQKGQPALKVQQARPESSCPSCGQVVRRLESKQKKGEFFWVHVEEPATCSKFLPDENGKPGERRQKAMS